MLSSRKRGRHEMDAVDVPRELSLLERIRNMWEFANLAQWIFTFGQAVKIHENLSIEELEMECLKPHSTVLAEIGLALLKFASTHRGLTPEMFDEYTRRLYVAKAPHRNPFGVEEEPKSFKDFDVFQKIRILQQLAVWIMDRPYRIRERMDEQKDTEQTLWRIEPFGWDSQGRTYIILDDNRLYRRTDPPPPAAKPTKNNKKIKASRRGSKRKRFPEAVDGETEQADEIEAEDNDAAEKEDDGFGGMAWECIAVSMDEFNTFTASIDKTRDANEKVLRNRIIDNVLPLLEKQEESRKRKQAQKERELLNLEKLATVKRSSRIAGKMEMQKHENEQREAERKKAAEIAVAKKEQEKWQKPEKQRGFGMPTPATREQRSTNRNASRILHEELATLPDKHKKIETREGRLSEHHTKAEIERKKKAPEEDQTKWIFDCICGVYREGVYGESLDDGIHSIACDLCNIWEHSRCLGIKESEADREDFVFICQKCRRKEAKRAKNQHSKTLEINGPASSSSQATLKPHGIPATVRANGNSIAGSSPQKTGYSSPAAHISPIQFPKQNGTPNLQPGFPSLETTPVQQQPLMQPPQFSGTHTSPQPVNWSTPKASYSGPYGPQISSGSPSLSLHNASSPSSSHAFSSPHPQSLTSLPPPGEPPLFTLANGSASQPGVPNTTSRNSPAQPGPHAYGTPSGSGNYIYGRAPSPSMMNEPRPGSSDCGRRRSSFNMPTPLAGVPVLTPSNKPPPPRMAPMAPMTTTSNSTATNPVVAAEPMKSSQPHPSPAPQGPPSTTTDSGHASALPSAATGLSPTKHSPPRSVSNGGFGSATPSILPPVASLSPSPQQQNLSSPIKPAEAPRPNIQAVGQ